MFLEIMIKIMIEVIKREWRFWLLFISITTLIAFVFNMPNIAMWVGFALAAYSAIGNDSIQTLGTFIASNSKVKWWILWLFIGGIFAITISYGWLNGDAAFGRLNKIPQVETFTFFHVFAPAVLLLLTRFSIPVSTTFLILSVFSDTKTIESMLTKTVYGYVVAFMAAFVIWWLLSKLFNRYFERKLSRKEEKTWRVFQWLSTSFLWATWLMQDTANIIVFLPRDLSAWQLLAVLAIGVALLGILLFYRGGKIQKIVREKKDVMQVRAATLIDLVLALILIYFKQINDIPMSTTWVFLGMLAGREIVLSHLATKEKNKRRFAETAYLVSKDIMLASIGLIVSIGLVFAIRPTEMLEWLKGIF